MYPAADSLTYMPITLRSTPPPPPPTFRVASTEAVSYDLSRGLPTCIFDYARFIFVQYVRIVLQCKPDVKLSYVILFWINPCLSLSLIWFYWNCEWLSCKTTLCCSQINVYHIYPYTSFPSTNYIKYRVLNKFLSVLALLVLLFYMTCSIIKCS